MSQIMKLATSCGLVLGALCIPATPASAEKSVEQIKCEKEGGTWSGKGNGHSVCFKRLPPMMKGSPTSSGRTGTVHLVSEHAINTKGTGTSGRSSSPGAACPDSIKSDPRPNSSQSGQTLRHAISTKGTGASGRSDPAGTSCAKKP